MKRVSADRSDRGSRRRSSGVLLRCLPESDNSDAVTQVAIVVQTRRDFLFDVALEQLIDALKHIMDHARLG